MLALPDARRGAALCAVAAATAALHLEPALIAQSDWHLQVTGASPLGRVAAYDSDRDRTVVLGVNGERSTPQIFEWDGAAWTRVDVPNPPDVWSPYGLVYDDARDVVRLFGTRFLPRNRTEVWDYDGNDWVRLPPPANAPPQLFEIGLSFDPRRGVTALIGRPTGASPPQAWELNGATWRRLPDPPTSGRMVHDAARARFVVLGDNGGATWEWDGAAWVRHGARPPARQGMGFGYDAARGSVVLFGGRDFRASGLTSDTWEWNGSVWVARPPLAAEPPARESATLVGDTGRGSLLLLGGNDRDTALVDTWEWDGVRWLPRDAIGGPPRRWHGLAFDRARERLVLFGGGRLGRSSVGSDILDETWEWDGATWRDTTPAAPAVSPPARLSPGLCYDEGHQRIVLFGGLDREGGTRYFGDTWEWDGARWVERTPATSPSPRAGHDLAYDSDRGRIVLFAGRDGTTVFSDTWEWDGQEWRLADPGRARIASVNLEYDTSARRTLAFFEEQTGGVATWEWDGRAWRQSHPTTRPGAGADSAVYDEARGRAVLLNHSETWEWDGVARTWSRSAPRTDPITQGHEAAYDSAREQVVLYGGEWVYLFPLVSAFRADVRARWEAYGAGCAGSLGVLELTETAGAPWLGDTVQLALTPLPAGSTPFVAFGFARDQVDLGRVGIPGCTLLVDPLEVFPITAVGSAASWTLTIPASAVLAGVVFDVQGIGLGAGGANAFGVALSNGIEGTVGAR